MPKIKTYDAETGTWTSREMTEEEYQEYMKQFQEVNENGN